MCIRDRYSDALGIVAIEACRTGRILLRLLVGFAGGHRWTVGKESGSDRNREVGDYAMAISPIRLAHGGIFWAGRGRIASEYSAATPSRFLDPGPASSCDGGEFSRRRGQRPLE